ncbi:aldo/keto reductase [Rhizobium mayense]|uniref:Aldo/keto reductase n=1 Tax=Rhizobium mayense TaxID=1312184 RepID=A0ABT7K5T4_9HYPH|nr:aldo/keto reductase [Rhizobium mayense]MDL2403977.1 aldo/keto reductase [Rhizobium mayense]
MFRKISSGEVVDRREIEFVKQRFLTLSNATDVKPIRPHKATLPRDKSDIIDGFATLEGTARHASLYGAGSSEFYAEAGGLLLSKLGVGTSIGSAVQEDYVENVAFCLRGGLNVIDTAPNYGSNFSESFVGDALRSFISQGGDRSGVVVITKSRSPSHEAKLSHVGNGTSERRGADSLRSQIDESRLRIGVSTIDVLLLHNLECQLSGMNGANSERYLVSAFTVLEKAASEGAIGQYGFSTWSGLYDNTLRLKTLVDLARSVAGEGHRLKFIEIPFNMGLVHGLPVIFEANDLNFAVLGSASLMQGALSDGLPLPVRDRMSSLATDALRALQFVRSTPGLAVALVGMSVRRHIIENLSLSNRRALDTEAYNEIVSAILDGAK